MEVKITHGAAVGGADSGAARGSMRRKLKLALIEATFLWIACANLALGVKIGKVLNIVLAFVFFFIFRVFTKTKAWNAAGELRLPDSDARK